MRITLGRPEGMPSGLITIWHGTIADIPSGHVICDGNNSTPNLLTKFVQGVATAASNPGATGGAATHTLQVAETPAHTHTIKNVYGGAGSFNGLFGQDVWDIDRATSSTGSDGAHENEPTFYDVAFIMKT